MSDLRRALLIVWFIGAAACGTVVALPFFAPASELQSVFPVCEARQRNSSCVACGLTTAFISIADGRWDDAQRANAAATPLFAGFLTNFAAAVAYTVRKLRSGGTACKS